MDLFREVRPNIKNNNFLRTPQKEAIAEIVHYYNNEPEEREVGIILPVGCGKSGLITLSPFAVHSRRTLVVAPGVNIAQQLHDDFDPTQPNMFYIKCKALNNPPYPEPVRIKGTAANLADLEEADVVITNIQQLQGVDNRWLNALPKDFFDLILFDEAHHNVASSWETLREAFPDAKIINYSATPRRADGQLMAGRIIYSYPIFRAIEEGYVKRLKALMLNPTTLRYVRREDGEEIEVGLEEVRRLGEEDADFRRSIVTSKETLNTIVDASIRELDRIRTETNDQRHKIIASALNFEHCIQIVQAYRERGRRAEYVHSRLDGVQNERVFAMLKNHQLDVIVQVRKLGEGFNHPYLSVAAVFSVFSELSPFVQFVGRIMRVIEQNVPNSPQNQGTVVFHAGANIARRWVDFQDFSQADQSYFDQLLPLEGWDYTNSDEIRVEPIPRHSNEVQVKAQSRVILEEIPLFEYNQKAKEAYEYLLSIGFTSDDYKKGELKPVPTTKIKERQAARASLDERVKNEVGRILHQRGIDPQGSELDQKRIGKTNFVVLKSVIDKKICQMVNRKTGERSEYSRLELMQIEQNLQRLILEAEKEVFGDA
jgi:superfamily II DNA or RNA helicase